MADKITIKPADLMMNLDGKALKDGEGKDLTLGKALALVLVNGKSVDPLRSYTLGNKMYQATEDLELDSSEVTFIKEALKNFAGYTDLVTGQVMEKLS